MRPQYKKMVRKMIEKENEGEAQPDQGWVLYILRCSGNTFYTGVTKDLERRLKMHNNGKASRYTRVRRPVELIYKEDCGSRARALTREYQVKALSRKEKEDLVECRKKSKVKGKTHG